MKDIYLEVTYRHGNPWVAYLYLPRNEGDKSDRCVEVEPDMVLDISIVFSPSHQTGLYRVAAAGGVPAKLTEPDDQANERTHRWPAVLPGGSAVLFAIGSNAIRYDNGTIAVHSFRTSETRVLVEGASMARYAAGHLVYHQGGVLWAAPFDAERLVLTGDPLPVQDRVAGDVMSGIAYFDLMEDGSLAFVPAGAFSREFALALVERSGTVEPIPLPVRPYNGPRFSPDGRRLAYSVGPNQVGVGDIWLYQLASGDTSRLTFDDAVHAPLWSPDGTTIAYQSALHGLSLKRADGSGSESGQYLPGPANRQFPPGAQMVGAWRSRASTHE